jgi:hypothetical protein
MTFPHPAHCSNLVQVHRDISFTLEIMILMLSRDLVGKPDGKRPLERYSCR